MPAASIPPAAPHTNYAPQAESRNAFDTKRLEGCVSEVLERLLRGNEGYVQEGWDPSDSELAAPPALRLAVVACMDTRHNVERVLGLKHGDAKVIRNAGNLVDDGTLRSLVVACHLLGVRHVAIMGHNKCGMTLVGRGEFRVARSIAATTDVPLHEAMRPDFQRWLGGFADPAENVRRSVDLVRNHPLLPKGLEVIGFVYDNDTGHVRPVSHAKPAEARTAAPLPAH
jgi:carbonic anhydrase